MANPIGPEPYTVSKSGRFSSVAESFATPEPLSETKVEDGVAGEGSGTELTGDPATAPHSTRDNSVVGDDVKQVSQLDEEVAELPVKPKKVHSLINEAQAAELEQRVSKNWLDLSMLEKLDSMHLLTEWQFHNPNRVRTMMKTDDETATWVSLSLRY